MAAVVTIRNGAFRQNGYLAGLDTGTAVAIDPGGEPERFRMMLADHGATLSAVLLTHGHFDHIGAAQDLVETFSVPCYLHSADHALARRAHLYSAALGGSTDVPRRALRTVLPLDSEDNPLTFGSIEVFWRSTPGHTDGSVCFIIGDHVFTGDTLLPAKHMALKLPGADPTALTQSVARMRSWNPDLLAGPGHGPVRCLGELLDMYGGEKSHGRD